MSILVRPFAESYVGVPRRSIETLSIEAVGLHAYILSLDTSVTLKELQQRAKFSRVKFRRLMAELLESGYLLERDNAYYPTDSTIVKGGNDE